MTNAHQHGKGDVRLAATIECTRVRVAVHDDSPALPSPRRATNDDTHGRGLFLVTALSDVCGLTVDGQLDGTGKAVWFELSLPPGPRRDRSGPR
ncbi:ATP-binding protein [Streptomyces sp. FXJ1.4098]|nr:ATP-binding protein [Streptomyces sp. FXJ1.4098]